MQICLGKGSSANAPSRTVEGYPVRCQKTRWDRQVRWSGRWTGRARWCWHVGSSPAANSGRTWPSSHRRTSDSASDCRPTRLHNNHTIDVKAVNLEFTKRNQDAQKVKNISDHFLAANMAAWHPLLYRLPQLVSPANSYNATLPYLSVQCYRI